MLAGEERVGEECRGGEANVRCWVWLVGVELIGAATLRWM